MTRCPHCNSKKFKAQATVVRYDDNGQPNAWQNTCKECGQPSIFDDLTGTQIEVSQWRKSQ